MTLRLQLLLLSLLTLLLPWAGCHYARGLEGVLRTGEEQALLATATTLAAVLAADGEPRASLTDPAADFDLTANDVYVQRLNSRPLLDGYANDWTIPGYADDWASADDPEVGDSRQGLSPESPFQRTANADGSVEVRYIAGTDGLNLYLLFKVSDSDVRLEHTVDADVDPAKRADHFWLVFTMADGTQHRYLFATSAPGLIGARQPVLAEFGQRIEQTEPRIQAWWESTEAGYRLEISVPLALAGIRAGFEAVDVGDFSAAPKRAGTLDAQTRAPLSGRLLMPARKLESKLAGLLPENTRAIVATPSGWVIAEAGGLAAAQPYEMAAEWLQSLYRRLLENGEEAPRRPPAPPGRVAGEHAMAALAGRKESTWFRLPDERRSVLAVGVPIGGNDGALILEQTSLRLLVLRDRAMTSLLNVTLLVTGAAVLAMFIFATALSIRLARLKRAAETGLTREGRVNTHMPGTGARDELGDLARSYERLLIRLNEYTEYLRTLAGKLSHELRTPLTIVRSSIENLESHRAGESPQAYLDRAREGADRLQAILTSMSAATRTEEAIRHAERKRFDLSALVTSITSAYADAFPTRRFETSLSRPAISVIGAPELLAQLLDKLADNAVDFSPEHSVITIELKDTTPGTLELAVINTGPPLPDAQRDRLFESMYQLRDRNTERGAPVHFGLGLYVVRLIADFHTAEVFAENLPHSSVRIGIRLPTT